jgi:translation initiation factor IF-2
LRVNELAKEIGKTNKEVLNALKEKGYEIKSHLSNINEEQISFIKSKLSKVTDSIKDKTKETEGKAVDSNAEPHKKKVTAVFRPQNLQQPKPNKSHLTSTNKSYSENENKASKNISKTTTISNDTSTVETDLKVENKINESKINEVSVEKEVPKKDISNKEVLNKENSNNETPNKENLNKENLNKENLNKEVLNKENTANLETKAEEKTLNKENSKGTDFNMNSNNAQNKNIQSQNDNTKAKSEKENVKPSQNQSNQQRNRDRFQNKTNANAEDRGQNKNRNWGDKNNFDRNKNKNFQNKTGQVRNYQDKNSQDRSSQDRNNQDRNQGSNFDRKSGNYQDRHQDKNRNFNQNQNRNNEKGTFDRGSNKNQPRKNFGSGNRSFGDNPFDKDKDIAPRNNYSRPKNQNKDSKPSIDAPLAKKISSTRINKNQFKNQKTDKKHRIEDGPVKGGKVSKHPFIMPVKKVESVEEDIKEIIIPESLTIKEFAAKLKLQPSTIVKKLFLKGELVTLNSEITFEKAEEIALEYDVICTLEEKVDVIAELLKEDEEDEKDLVERPPVVCVIGHIDHGKTSLLDAIRNTSVTSREAGGITQHIGAYMVKVGEHYITFLDTPGHEAFTAMRMRGAQSTDIAILVVAADDGVMPQTIEAISHAKAANVEVIVAINKIDKPGANVDRVKQELSEYELIPEDWGGTTIFCEVSAKTGAGIDNLLEMITLTAELKELKANPNRKARGVVIEAKLDKGKGSVATILVQKGTLRVGDYVSAGACSGKVRAMINDKGQRVKEATPSMPVEIQGLDNAPNAGEVLVAANNHNEAKAFAATFISENKNKLIEDTKAKLSLDDLFNKIKEGNLKELPLIVKADVQGSVEAVKQSLLKLSNDEVQVRIIHGGVGSINESDVALAAASNAIIIGFNVRPDVAASVRSENEGVDVRLYKVIYAVIDDIENAMKGMLAPVFEEKIIGHAEIRKVYKASGIGSIAGSYILDGKFQRGCKVRITRENEQIFDGNLASLKRFQDDVKEVAAGYECGLAFEKFNDIAEADKIEAYVMEQVPRK